MAPRERTAPLTSSEAARAIVDEARAQGIPGPPFNHSDWERLAKEVGWIIEPPSSDPGVEWSKETLAAEEEQVQLNARIHEAWDKLAAAQQRSATRTEWVVDRENVTRPSIVRGDAAAGAEVVELQDVVRALEAEHLILCGRLTRLRARDRHKHVLRQGGLVDKARAALR